MLGLYQFQRVFKSKYINLIFLAILQVIIKWSDFIESMEKASKLHKNDLLTAEEFKNKKEKLIRDIQLNKIAEEPEDFLTCIIPLKEKEILTQDELLKIKEIILN